MRTYQLRQVLVSKMIDTQNVGHAITRAYLWSACRSDVMSEYNGGVQVLRLMICRSAEWCEFMLKRFVFESALCSSLVVVVSYVAALNWILLS
jgi:hypothetical protein